MRSLFAEAMPAAPMVVRKPQDLFRLMYTSGTTDRPKGVVHTYENFYWKSMEHVIALELSAKDRLLAVGPLYHVGAFDLPGVAVWWVGGSIVLHRQFDEAAALAAIEAERITCAWFAPMMVGRMLALPDRGRYDLSSFRWCIAGGEKTPEGRIRDFTGLFVNGRFIDGYGLTETCSGDTLMEAGREIEKIGSTGRAMPHVQVEIRDDEGRALPPGVEGEICLRGPKVTRGLLEGPGEDGEELLRRLVPQRRRRCPRRGRFPHHHRPQEGHDHFRRREHRLERGRARHLRTARGRRMRRHRPARREVGRAPGGRGRAEARHSRQRRGRDRRLRCQARPLQGAEGSPFPRQPAAQPIRQGAEAGVAGRDDGPGGRPRLGEDRNEEEQDMTLSERIGEFVAGLDTGRLPPEVVEKARTCLLNGYGIGLGCHDTPYAPVARAAALALDGERGDGATLLGDGRKVAISGAALANAALFHGRGQEDTCGAAHLGAIMIPMLTAMVESRGYPLDRLIPALVAGYETGGLLEQAFSGKTTPRGLRSSPLYGSIAAAAAAARMMALSPERAAAAIGNAASFTGGILQTFADGTDEWRYQVGWAARNGLVAAELAAHGSVTAPHALEGPSGFARAFAGVECDVEALAAKLGRDWSIHRVTFKPYPGLRLQPDAGDGGARTARGSPAGRSGRHGCA
jgi:acyl-CoA synthetase (AMP-forming)/AMP-acid ligase II